MVLITGLENITENFGYLAIFGIITASSFGLPIPEELVLLVAGWAASQHFISLPIAVFVAVLAIFIGDNIGYYLGKKYGQGFLNRYVKGEFRKKFVDKLINAFHKHPDRTIFLARFVMGLRFISPILSGAGKIKWREFVMYDFAGILIFVPAVVGIGYFAGQNLALIAKAVQGSILAFSIVMIIIGFGLGFWLVKRRRAKA